MIPKKGLFADVTDGELLLLTPVAEEPVYRYVYPGGYMTMGIVMSSKFLNYNLKRSATFYRLALTIAALAVPVTGLVHCSNADYAQELGVSKEQIARTISQLVKAGLIYRMGHRTVLVNPLWAFKGTPKQHHAAVEYWQTLHPIGIVSRAPEPQVA